MTHALLPGSLAIDAGNNALAVDASGSSLTSDQRGVDRVEFGTVDIGAVEGVILLGDANLNGIVNFLDIPPFVSLLSSRTYLNEADINRDGIVNFLDISRFAALLTSGGSASGKQFVGNLAEPAIESGPAVTSQAIVFESQDSSAVSMAGPTSQQRGVERTAIGVTPVDTYVGPVAFASGSDRNLGDRGSNLESSENKESFSDRRFLALDLERPDYSDDSRDTHSTVNGSSERSFSTAADLFDAHPESLDDVFDFQLEDVFANLID